MEALQASALPLGYATKVEDPFILNYSNFRQVMFTSVQAEGMGGVTVAYPLDSPSAYHQPAIRTSLGSRVDLQAFQKKVAGFGVNGSLCSWIAGGLNVFDEGIEGGVAFSILSNSIGFSLRSGGYTLGLHGDLRELASYGVTYCGGKSPEWNLGLAIHPHPSLTLVTEIHRVGIEWRPFRCFALRGGYLGREDRFTLGGTYYLSLTKEFSIFGDSKRKWGIAAAIKW